MEREKKEERDEWKEGGRDRWKEEEGRYVGRREEAKEREGRRDGWTKKHTSLLGGQGKRNR